MSFRAHRMPELRSYDHAVQKFEAIKPWRGSGPDEMKPLHPDRTWRRFGIVKETDGSIACRLWNTDCVEWHPDNSITIRTWASRSTNAFVNAIVPTGINADFCHDDCMVWIDVFERYDDGSCKSETRGYSVPHSIRLKRSIHGDRFWVLHEDSHPPKTFTNYSVNRAHAKEVRKALGLEGLQTWLAAVASMEKQKKRKPFQSANYKYLSDSSVVDLVKQGFDGWRQITEKWGWHCADRVLMACYRYEGAIDEREDPYIVGCARWGNYNAWKSRQRRYL